MKKEILEDLIKAFKGEEMSIFYFNNKIKEIIPFPYLEFKKDCIICNKTYIIKFHTIGGFVEEKDYFGNTVIKVNDIVINDSLYTSYCEWRKVSQEMLNDGMNGSVDCGEISVREDFSNFISLEKEITFDEMFDLEKRYEIDFGM